MKAQNTLQITAQDLQTIDVDVIFVEGLSA